MSYIIGFDLSLTAPGACALPINWKPGEWKRVKSSLLKTKDPKSKDDQRGQIERYEQIAEWALGFVGQFDKAPSIFIEDYGFSKNNASASRIMESGGVVRHELYRLRHLLTHNVTASQARKLLLGFNPQKRKKDDPDAKVVVQDALFNKAGAPKAWDENQCDAFVIANFGLSECGSVALTLV